MNQLTNPATENPAAMPDVQKAPDERHIGIDLVGIKALRHPIKIIDRDAIIQHSVALCNMYVSLPHHQKGTHMSRFIEILSHHSQALSIQQLPALMAHVLKHLDSDAGLIEISFPFFVEKKAPISQVASFLDYDVTFRVQTKSGKTISSLQVTAPVTSLCPCSKKISDYGAHNQRSHITVIASTQQGELWIRDIIDIIEKQASCELWGLLKRPDEKYVTEYAYDNPKFVEDLVRDIAVELNKNPHITTYTVEAENFESIHNHSAYARIEKSAQHAQN